MSEMCEASTERMNNKQHGAKQNLKAREQKQHVLLPQALEDQLRDILAAQLSGVLPSDMMILPE